ncbi:UDP-N-acetylmuramoyl-tripeptide--D-alanyl-D-alanine ligase [Peribacillus frigoritolerans]|uniref:UDP-N-acetylmuramoyl-tripeptide--D-alanyl-D- alanine ligase n=1 Tax=Peribacillus frigoritolerans TaxID=450367 RepID=UPI002B05458A|nr:UDP-N-acetylmuramoyl-tripeptide--D-alanyl-D-alanine ligase [Peribacillus frigoritolerans]MEA3577713.1 UDP-N-acetylmuramoyl-tripeptide--D-alanyl-D-alanine ligase [Peribacillus frigoritolerans]
MDEKHKTRPIIAITGSAGKTTTKEMVACILSTRMKILKSQNNLNLPVHTNHYAQSISHAHQAIVLEYGLQFPGEIKKHCSIIQPNISVITNIGSAHVGNFNSSIVELARAKSEIIEGMDSFGRLYVNADDSNSKFLLTDPFKGPITTVGIEKGADYRASHVSYCDTGMIFQVEMNGKKCDFMIPILGIHNIYNALFSIAVTHQLGFTPEEIQQGFNDSLKFLINTRRLNLYKIGNNIQIIDDTWSANPQAMKAALDVLENIGNNNNIAVLANMLELGNHTIDGHLEVGKYLATKKVDLLFTYGDYAKYISNGAIQSGFPKEKVFHFNSLNVLNPALLKILKPGSTVLIKGSHSVMMNRIVDFLRAYSQKK